MGTALHQARITLRMRMVNRVAAVGRGRDRRDRGGIRRRSRLADLTTSTEAPDLDNRATATAPAPASTHPIRPTR